MGSKVHQAREWLASCIPSPFWDKYGTGLLGVIASINKFKKYWEYWVKGKNRQDSLSCMNFRISASRWEGNLLLFLLSILCCFSLPSQSLDNRVHSSILVFFSTFSLPITLSPVALNITARLTSPEFWSPTLNCRFAYPTAYLISTWMSNKVLENYVPT